MIMVRQTVKQTDKKPENVAINEDMAEKYFNCTPSERAAFEAGIKLGAIFHQFVGTPVDLDNVTRLETAIKESIRIQPYVESVSLSIDRTNLKNKVQRPHTYGYKNLTGDMINAHIKVRYKNSVAIAKMDFIKELNYPLMYLSISNK